MRIYIINIAKKYTKLCKCTQISFAKQLLLTAYQNITSKRLDGMLVSDTKSSTMSICSKAIFSGKVCLRLFTRSSCAALVSPMSVHQEINKIPLATRQYKFG